MQEETGTENLLVARHLVKRFGDLTAVDDVSLSVRAGEIVGLLGPNGAGKTTTLNMCIGLLRPTSGEVTVAGMDIARHSRAAKALIGYVPDEPYLYDKLTGREFVLLMARLYGVRAEAGMRAAELLAYFGVLDAADDLIGGYSHGMKQKIAVCGMLIHQPRLLFLDEPTVGLDPRSARLLRNTLQQLAREGRGIILCTHILDIAQAICHRVAILDHGVIVAEGTMDELRQHVRAESLEDIFLQLTGEDEEQLVARSLLAT